MSKEYCLCILQDKDLHMHTLTPKLCYIYLSLPYIFLTKPKDCVSKVLRFFKITFSVSAEKLDCLWTIDNPNWPQDPPRIRRMCGAVWYVNLCLYRAPLVSGLDRSQVRHLRSVGQTGSPNTCPIRSGHRGDSLTYLLLLFTEQLNVQVTETLKVFETSGSICPWMFIWFIWTHWTLILRSHCHPKLKTETFSNMILWESIWSWCVIRPSEHRMDI